MRPHIMVVDIETTGLKGEPLDHIVEVGVACLMLDTKEIHPVYEQIVRPYYPIDEEWQHSWVFENTTLTPEDVLDGNDWEVVRNDLFLILNGRYATSYNYAFDFDKFLSQDPWNLPSKKAPCIMLAAGRAYADDLPCSEHSGCPSAQSPYSYLCPDNPAELPNGREEHRALSDAIMEAHILRKMIQDGEYIIEGIE